MKNMAARLAGHLIILAAAVAHGAPLWAVEPQEDGASEIAPVLGGTRVDWPWMMAVLMAGEEDPYFGQFCAASLIAPTWALTAAHCYYGYEDLEDYDVLLGTTLLRPGLGVRVAVDEVVIHEDFVPPDATGGIAFDNDIALLRLAEPVRDITPVTLAPPNFNEDEVPAGTYATLRGWGATAYDEDEDFSHAYPDYLISIDLPMLEFSACSAALGESWFSRNMLCAGLPEGGRDTCQGDSGGPLALPADNENGVIQLGLVSWGIGCGIPGFYGVYTRVSRYTDWITRQICGADETPERPELEVDIEGTSVTLRYGVPLTGNSYRLYYTSLRSGAPIRHLDLGIETSYKATLPAGASLRVAVQSYRGNCHSDFSKVKEVHLPG